MVLAFSPVGILALNGTTPLTKVSFVGDTRVGLDVKTATTEPIKKRRRNTKEKGSNLESFMHYLTNFIKYKAS